MRRGLWSIVIGLVVGATAQGAAPSRCSHETLHVRGKPVAVTYCVASVPTAPAGAEVPVNVLETYTSAKGSFSQPSTLQFIAGQDTSRVIEDVDLARLGIAGTLHVTLAFRNGSIAIESAILTPGAITVK